LIKWAKKAYQSSTIETKKEFLQKLINFKAMHLPTQWKELLQGIASLFTYY
jgi:hypothetical protein